MSIKRKPKPDVVPAAAVKRGPGRPPAESAKRPLKFTLTPDLLVRLDAQKKRMGLSRSAVVTVALYLLLEQGTGVPTSDSTEDRAKRFIADTPEDDPAAFEGKVSVTLTVEPALRARLERRAHTQSQTVGALVNAAVYRLLEGKLTLG